MRWWSGNWSVLVPKRKLKLFKWEPVTIVVLPGSRGHGNEHNASLYDSSQHLSLCTGRRQQGKSVDKQYFGGWDSCKFDLVGLLWGQAQRVAAIWGRSERVAFTLKMAPVVPVNGQPEGLLLQLSRAFMPRHSICRSSKRCDYGSCQWRPQCFMTRCLCTFASRKGEGIHIQNRWSKTVDIDIYSQHHLRKNYFVSLFSCPSLSSFSLLHLTLQQKFVSSTFYGSYILQPSVLLGNSSKTKTRTHFLWLWEN